MKSLCREIVWLLNDNSVKVIKGQTPTIKDVDALPGKYLLNPGARTNTTQPLYEEDYPAWLERLTMSGG